MKIKLKNDCIGWIGCAGLALAFLMVVVLLKPKENPVKESETMVLDITKFKIDNRVSLLKDKELLIGEKTIELENGFYDIKLAYSNEMLKINLNKLWINSYKEDYIEDEYLILIIAELVRILDIDETTQDVEYEIYKYIKQNFVKAKNGENIPMLELENMQIISKSEESEMVLYIKREP